MTYYFLCILGFKDSLAFLSSIQMNKKRLQSNFLTKTRGQSQCEKSSSLMWRLCCRLITRPLRLLLSLVMTHPLPTRGTRPLSLVTWPSLLCLTKVIGCSVGPSSWTHKVLGSANFASEELPERLIEVNGFRNSLIIMRLGSGSYARRSLLSLFGESYLEGLL